MNDPCGQLTDKHRHIGEAVAGWPEILNDVEQLARLASNDPHAVKAISAIMEDEQQHHDRSELHAKAGTFWPRVLRPVVAAATETVIWLGMRL